MARLPQPSMSADNQDTGGFDPVPAGVYPVEIIKSPRKQNKAKTGHYLNLQMKIIEGKYKGRFIFDILNLWNPSTVASEIANKTSNQISKACDLTDVEESEEWHGIPIAVRVVVRPATSEYAESNEVKKYMNLDDADIGEDDDPWEEDD